MPVSPDLLLTDGFFLNLLKVQKRCIEIILGNSAYITQYVSKCDSVMTVAAG